jgi:hypothetical protein
MQANYRLSFTGASLFLHESISLARLCLEYNDCAMAINHIMSADVVSRSKSTVKRESSEIKLRLNALSKSLLEKFTMADQDEAKVILLYAIMKTYPIVKEFCLEILYEKSLLLDNHLQEYEINGFWRRKEEEHDELHKKSDATKYKLKQVMLKILADAGILNSTKEKIIVKPFFDAIIAKMISEDSDVSYLKALLMNDTEIAIAGVR